MILLVFCTLYFPRIYAFRLGENKSERETCLQGKYWLSARRLEMKPIRTTLSHPGQKKSKFCLFFSNGMISRPTAMDLESTNIGLRCVLLVGFVITAFPPQTLPGFEVWCVKKPEDVPSKCLATWTSRLKDPPRVLTDKLLGWFQKSRRLHWFFSSFFFYCLLAETNQVLSGVNVVGAVLDHGWNIEDGWMTPADVLGVRYVHI